MNLKQNGADVPGRGLPRERIASNAPASTVSSRVGDSVPTAEGACAAAPAGKATSMRTSLTRIQDFSRKRERQLRDVVKSGLVSWQEMRVGGNRQF